jgi:hypothetical protein
LTKDKIFLNLFLTLQGWSSFNIVSCSVADPDPFDTDPDPAFHFDPDPTVIYLSVSGSLPFLMRYGNVPKTVLLYIFT